MQAEILNASAGSGKTYRLAYHYVRDVVWKPALYRHILAVTFTNKATEEMKSRILKEIDLLASNRKSNYLQDLIQELGLREEVIRQRAREARSAILHDYSRFTVLTIDKFFQRILHAFVKELGLELNYEIELESAPILSRGVDALIERITHDRELKEWLEAFARERIEEQKGWDLREGILKLGKELFSEGSREKMANSCPRERLLEVIEGSWQAMKKSQKEFREMGRKGVEMIEQMGLSLNDFSNKSTSGANYFYKVAAGEIEEPGARALAYAESCEVWFPKKSPYGGQTAEPLHRQMKELCSWYYSHLKGWRSAHLMKEHFRTYILLNDLYSEIQRLWREENRLLLSETKNILSLFIDRNDAPFIYEKVGNRYDRYLIDEFQDTSEREWLNFKPLLQDALSHATQLTLPGEEEPGSTVLLVGDTKQSIYRWRGGDWRILSQKAPEALSGSHVESMTNNFRSLRQVVEFNNALMGQVVRLDNLQIKARIEEGAVAPQVAEELCKILPGAYTDHAQQARKKSSATGYVSVESCDKQPPIVERICQILDLGYRPSDLLILVRRSREGARVARTLLDFKRQNRNPRYHFNVMTQDSLNLNASPLCCFIIALLRLCITPDDTISRAICNHYLNRAVDTPWGQEESLWLASLKQLSTETAFEEIILRYHLHEGETAYLQALHEQVIHFSSGRVTDIALFLDWWDEHSQDCSLQIGKSEQTLEISTIHKAKGLERKVVVIPYCDWELDAGISGSKQNILWARGEGELAEVGRLPLKYSSAMSDSHFSEEFFREMTYSHVDSINLLYVALTRAVEQLHIFIPNRNRNLIGSLVWEGIAAEDGEARIPLLVNGEYRGDCIGRVSEVEGGFMRYEFGTMESPIPEKSSSSESAVTQRILTHYPTVRPTPELRLPNARYLDHGGEAEFSPRNFGILMHRLFEEATNREELVRALQRMRQEALVTEEEADELARRVEQVLQDPVVAAWYDQKWERILSERDIIRPANRKERVEVRRPDRVMLRGKRAVVVDYKFGEKDPASNRSQIRRYMTLLKEMGYQEVEGWLWYVRLGRTEQVEE